MTQGFIFVTYMIKLIDYKNQEITTLLHDKHIPREGEYIVNDEHSYRVQEVIYNDDDDTIFLRVEEIVATRYGIPRYAGVPLSEDKIEEVRRLALSDLKLQAIKLYKDLTGKSLKESKDFVDSLT